MDLDQHASRAAHDLRRRVEGQVDVPASRAAFDAAAGRRRAAATRARVGLVGAAAAVLALVGLVAVVGEPGGGGDDLTTQETRVGQLPGESSAEAARSAAILNALPKGPIDGRDSWRLPVVVRPQSGVRDGQTVTVYGRGFEPEEQLGIVQCTSEADTNASGVNACQLAAYGESGGFGAVTYATSSSEGTVVAEVVVRRYVETPEGGRVDCQSAAERCLIGVGAVSNYDRSGGTYVGFAGAPPFAQPALSITPAGPYAAGQQVTAKASGMVPLRGVRLQQCKGEVCEDLIDTKADAAGDVSAAVVLQPTVQGSDGGREVACDGGCVLRATGIGVKGQSAAPLPDDVPLAFTDAVITTTVPASTAPEATAPETTAPPATAPGDPGGTTTSEPAVTTAPTTPDGTEDPVTTTSIAGP